MADVPMGIARRLQESFRDFLHEFAEMFGEYGFLSDCERQLRELESGIVQPFNVAVVGMVKRGKSSILNALLERDLAITGLEETTATVNVISHSSDPTMQDKFTVHWKDGQLPETFPLDRLLVDWSGKSPGILGKVTRTAFLQLYSNAKLLGLHEIIDTPGLGAAVTEHEVIAQAFLNPSLRDGRKADALIYVFGPNAKESDVQNLLKFREGCLPHSSPYNSVGVLHKWDDIYWNANGNWMEIQSKVDRTKQQMSSVVSDVIPVSAPLARTAQTASDENLAKVIGLVAKAGSENLQRWLRIEKLWIEDSGRASLLAAFPIPLECFRVMFLEAIKLGADATPNTLRARLRELGGIDRLRSFLDRNFFKSAALIRQRQQYAKFLSIQEEADARIRDRQEELKGDAANWDDLVDRSLEPRSLAQWIERKRFKATSELDTLKCKWEVLDKRLRNSGVKKILDDLADLDWCEAHPERVSHEELTALRAMADRLAGDTAAKLDMDVLLAIQKRFSTLRNGAIDATGRKSVNRLGCRIRAVVCKQ